MLSAVILSVVMLIVFMLSVLMLSIIMMNVTYKTFMLSVVAPLNLPRHHWSIYDIKYQMLFIILILLSTMWVVCVTVAEVETLEDRFQK